MASDRFVNNTLSELQEANRNPISGYENSPVLTLEEAVEKLIPLISNVTDYVVTAKKKYNWHSTLLTRDESAAIYLYSMPTSFFSQLNQTLRAENRDALKPWFPFLKLFLTALKKLPSTTRTIWRGVSGDAGSIFTGNDVHIWWSINSCSMALDVVQLYLGDNGTLFAIDVIDGKDISSFSTFPEEKEIVLMPGTHVRAQSNPLTFIDRLRIVHLEEINPQSKSPMEFDYLFEEIKQEYRQNSRIERFMDPAISFPIEQSYINLSMVEKKEQYEKEKLLRDGQQATVVLGTYEQIYGTKTAMDVKDIFEACKNHEKQVLVFGRAGIGKSTFCRYIAYQWATGSYWPHYELLALIPLRRLILHYPTPDKSCSLIDLVKKELFPLGLDKNQEELFSTLFDPKKTLWILDGYDEIVQNVLPHLQRLLEQLLKTPHHIITSRPYLNTLSYDVQMEITGFTDKNIRSYVQNFFNQVGDESDGASTKGERLLSYLESNRSIWGVAHIPLLLELICSLWITQDFTQTARLTITRLYTEMTEWLCRRYLRTQNNQISQLFQHEIDERCQRELTVLETLAFRAIQHNTIIIQPALLKEALQEAKISSEQHPHILNIGILKSFHRQGMGIRIETKKDHYFVHLSFQEYFAARYLTNALQGPQTEQAIEFIKYQKYNQRYTLVFSFTAGFLSEKESRSGLNLFWNTLLGEPRDLVGIRHIQLVIDCMEETVSKSTLPRYSELLAWLAKCVNYSFTTQSRTIREHLSQSLKRVQSVTCDPIIGNVLIDLLRHEDETIRRQVLSSIGMLEMRTPPSTLMKMMVTSFKDKDLDVRMDACFALGKMGEKAATNEVITKLLSALRDESEQVRIGACFTLGNMGEKAATNEVITKLVSTLRDEREWIRTSACFALGQMGEKAATNEVITKLVSALEDESEQVRRNACEALGNMREKAATSEVITKLVSALGDESEQVRGNACVALGKMGEKAATNEVITKLVSALGDESEQVRGNACVALGKMGEKAATNEVITKLVSALGDESEQVRRNACFALRKMGEKAATNEVITKLVSALGDESEQVRGNACVALGKMGEKAATNGVITKLFSALEDESERVRGSACFALGQMGEKAATNEVITKLVSALEDESEQVRRNACEALGNMREKAATSEVITKLVSALGDESEQVRGNACVALGKMGEKAATNEVITKLVSALEDESEQVRGNACDALRKMGEKAATNEVITKLVSALGDESEQVRGNACVALGKMGEKAATNEVIDKAVSTVNSGDYSYEVVRIMKHFVSSSSVIKQLGPTSIANICLDESVSDCLRNVAVDYLLNIFVDTKNSDWLTAIARLAILNGSAVTVMEDKVIVFGDGEPTHVLISDSELRQRLIKILTDESKELHLGSERHQ